MKRIALILFLAVFSFGSYAGETDSLSITVHFLYGSIPKKQYRNTEKTWFGGIHGGHAGVEIGPNIVLSFFPKGKFHYIEKHANRHSAYSLHDTIGFWEIFGSRPQEVKRVSIVIPISAEQKQLLDSISDCYQENTPYDYAFLGMRCGAATYDILAQLGILEPYGRRSMWLKIFYPQKLRRRLLKKAEQNHWKIFRQEGSGRRKWENE